MKYEELDRHLVNAEAEIYIGKYDEAEASCRRVLAALEAPHPDLLLRARALRLLAELLRQKGRADEAMPVANEALAAVGQTGSNEETTRIKAVIGYIYRNIGEYQRALELLENALAEHRALGLKTDLPPLLNQIGIVYTETGNVKMALDYFFQALAAHEEPGAQSGVAGHVLSNIGNMYLASGDTSRALEYQIKALGVFEEWGNKAGIATVLGKIGGIYSEFRNFPLALEYLGKSLEVQTALDIKRAMADTLGSIGFVYAFCEEFPLALEYCYKSLAINEECSSKGIVAHAVMRIGAVHHLSGDFHRALDYYARALAAFGEVDAKGEITQCLSNMGELYANESFDGYDAAKAEELLLESIALGKEIEVHSRSLDQHEVLAKLYRRQKRWEEADRYFQEFYRLEKEYYSEKAKMQADKFTIERQNAEREKQIAIAKAAAEAEMSATTSLLHKVLPPSIASRLIKGEKVADYFSQVSILFADIVGFTPIASKMPARKVLAFLNFVFGEFDRIIEKHGCEKIKTIGDGYMAVAGAPVECADHAERIARAAMEMMGDIHLPDDIRSALPKGAKFSIRIGINIGPAFGGIVGEKRFVYDIYSDAVNTAARMESHGEPNKIHVSEEFAFHLQNRMDMTGDALGGIVFEEREEIEIKGKGKMKTYFMERT